MMGPMGVGIPLARGKVGVHVLEFANLVWPLLVNGLNGLMVRFPMKIAWPFLALYGDII